MNQSDRTAEILGDTYCRQVLLPRITNNQAQDSTRDSAQPYVQTLGTYGQTKLGQKKNLNIRSYNANGVQTL